MKRTLFLGALWALLVLIVVAGYYTLYFLLHLLEVLQRGSYGLAVYVKCVRVIGASVLYHAWPYAVLVFSMYAFRSRTSGPQVSLRLSVLASIVISSAFFVWFAFRNPVLYKANMALTFDIRMKVPPEEFGRYENYINLPSAMNYIQLNEEIETSEKRYDSLRNATVSFLQQSASYACIDSLLTRGGPISISMFDSTTTPLYSENSKVLSIRLQSHVQQLQWLERNITEARNKRNRMLVYPLIIWLMFAIGWSAGPLIRADNWLLIPPVVILGLFPALATLQMVVEKYSSSWQSLISVPVALVFIWVIVASLSKRRHSLSISKLSH